MLLRTCLAALTTGIALAAAPGGTAAAAPPPVDLTSLVPPPPPGSECHAAGTRVICRTTLDSSVTDEPVFSLPCGQVYETADDLRRGLRWYEGGQLVRRSVFQHASGSWSLAEAGPTVTWTAHANWRNVDVDPQAAPEEWPTTYHGLQFRIDGPDGRPILHFAGIVRPDGSHSGAGSNPDFASPELQVALCTALTAR